MAQMKFEVSEMQCSGCESTIETAVSKLDGIEMVSADYPTGMVDVYFDEEKIKLDEIQKLIAEKGYPTVKTKPKGMRLWIKFVLILIAVAGLIGIMIATRKLSYQFTLPEINSHLSEGMIFFVGLVTGLHCVGMCGGFVVSYTAKDAKQGRSSWLSHLLYGLGKTLSYAMFGALFGFLGSMISITLFIQGVTNLVAGGFLILFGLNMVGAFAILRYVRIKQPKSITKFANKRRERSRSPFFIGFFSGFLLGCGPLQAMYVIAAGSSDPILGAKMLTFFGLGTLPALLSFGYIARLLSAKITHRFFQLSGIILIFVGLMMFNKGLLRTNSGYDFMSIKHCLVNGH